MDMHKMRSNGLIFAFASQDKESVDARADEEEEKNCFEKSCFRGSAIPADRQIESAQEEDQRTRLLQLSGQEIEKQNNVNQLEAVYRQTQQETQWLEEDRQRLQSAVDKLTVKHRQLTEEEQVKTGLLVDAERERKSVIDKLHEKELELRQNIDHLETCLRRLQTKIDDAKEDEKELQLRIEHLNAIGGEIMDNGGGQEGPNESQVEGHQIERVELGTMVRRVLNVDDEPALEESNAPSPSLPGPSSPSGAMILRERPESVEEVSIKFKVFENGHWKVKHEMMVDPREPSEVMRVAIKYMRKKFGLFNSNSKVLTPETCFERVTSDGTYSIHLIPAWTLDSKERRKDAKPRKRIR
ncbi:hypothetical protein VFPPC_10496 [Pochonia chlamydosporia 170]|uniref:Uncharacterized protein n=1 Tax=Pochonia chlamydosporia 170 TaxID=1380566 RepID=A0A179F1Y0_METCM|nr:hypothetical protein VFPPC_10496 [Pochonia chlamydosporia 170]OAQ59438.1 hypothetical protein VFPPC_10496 [Pochonia chlamydosporia 170]